jgi:hypothetical protein
MLHIAKQAAAFMMEILIARAVRAFENIRFAWL